MLNVPFYAPFLDFKALRFLFLLSRDEMKNGPIIRAAIYLKDISNGNALAYMGRL